MQAAILQVKLKYFDGEVSKRQAIAEQYNLEYQEQDVITPMVMPDRTHVYGQYTIRVKDRDVFREAMKAQGLPTSVHYPVPLNKQEAFKDGLASCPVSDKLSEEVVSLPMCLYT